MTTQRTTHTNSPENAPIPDLDRHARTCTICRSPHREAIEELFLHWIGFYSISMEYDVQRSAFYRHAHATGLFALRRRNYRFALERLLENVDSTTSHLSGDHIIRAVRACGRLNEEGQWVDPPQRIIVTRSSEDPARPSLDANPADESRFLTGTEIQAETHLSATKQTTEVNSNREKIDPPTRLPDPAIIHKSW